MARMHSRRRGKSGSSKPLKKTKLVWIRYKKEEVEKLVIKLANQDKTNSEIGIILRDSYGVPSVKDLTNNKISKILEKNNLKKEIPEDLRALINREVNLVKHIERNKQDKTAKRGLQLTTSKINRLSGYYKRNGVLSKDWSYDLKQAKVLVK